MARQKTKLENWGELVILAFDTVGTIFKNSKKLAAVIGKMRKPGSTTTFWSALRAATACASCPT